MLYPPPGAAAPKVMLPLASKAAPAPAAPTAPVVFIMKLLPRQSDKGMFAAPLVPAIMICSITVSESRVAVVSRLVRELVVMAVTNIIMVARNPTAATLTAINNSKSVKPACLLRGFRIHIVRINFLTSSFRPPTEVPACIHPGVQESVDESGWRHRDRGKLLIVTVLQNDQKADLDTASSELGAASGKRRLNSRTL